MFFGTASSFIDRISFSEIEAKREAILFLFGCSEVNSNWIITSGLAYQRAPKALFTCVVYTNKYYYLGLDSKVKQGTADPDMCSKMTAHWSEKEHWINGNGDGWKIKKEVWDGARFAELAWFWDPDKSWCLPARCAREGCKNVYSADEVLQATAQPNGKRELYCECCCTTFLHQPVFVKGDPRNIAYIGKVTSL